MWKMLVIVLSITACAPSLADRINAEISIGDSYTRIREILGPPKVMNPTGEGANGTIEYGSNKHVCILTITDGFVSDKRCKINPSYENPAALILNSMGTALQHSQDNTWSCQDFGNGQISCYNPQRGYVNCTQFNGTTNCR